MNQSLDKFSEQEIDNLKRKIQKIEVLIEDYNIRSSDNTNESAQLRNAIQELNLFFRDGKKQWFNQYKDIIQNYFIKDGLTGVRNKILIVFHSLWADLPLLDRVMVSELRTGVYVFPNTFSKTPSSLLTNIDKEFNSALKQLHGGEVEVHKLTDSYHQTIKYSIPNFSEDDLFQITASDVYIKVEKLYTQSTAIIAQSEKYLLRIVADVLL